jgi:predicted DNA-binding transcriptional regulator AlpA
VVSLLLRVAYNTMKKSTEAQFLSVSQVAVRLGISATSVRRKFAGLPGVLNIGSVERMHKPGRRILRIPEATVERYIAEHQANRRK